MRYWILLLSVLLAGCVNTETLSSGKGYVLIETVSDHQPLSGVHCIAKTDSSNWNLVTPHEVLIIGADGDLRVTCNKSGYYTSEVIHQAPPGLLRTPGTSNGLGIGLNLNLPLSVDNNVTIYPSHVQVEMKRL